MIFTLQSHEIAQHWDEIEPFLFDYYEWTPAQVRQALESAQAQFWGIKDDRLRSIVITQTNYPIGLIWIAAGTLDAEGRQLLSAIELWMKEKGMRDVKIEGRKGFGRVLEGYEEKATVFLKRLA